MPQQMGNTADPASRDLRALAQLAAPNPRIAELARMCCVNGLEHLRHERSVVAKAAPITCRPIGRRIMAQRFPKPENTVLRFAAPHHHRNDCVRFNTGAQILINILGIGHHVFQQLLQQSTGVVRLPAGVLEVTEEIQIPRGAHDLEIEGAPAGTVLRAADHFHGRAILSLQSASKVTLRNITFDGNREALAAPGGLPPSNVPFADFYGNNGLLARDVKSLTLSQVKFVNIANYAVLISRSHGILIDRIEVADSGSHNEQGRNNASGGVLLEEGTSAFTVRDSVFRNIRGNGVWTHSLYTSPRNRDGLISGNRFSNLGRDAIQVGHATNIRVTANRGERIGYPVAEVDAAGGGTPVAIRSEEHTSELQSH